MSDLVTSFQHDDFLPYLVVEDVVDDSFCIKMCKLNWKSLESMALGNVVLDAGLELIVREG